MIPGQSLVYECCGQITLNHIKKSFILLLYSFTHFCSMAEELLKTLDAVIRHRFVDGSEAVWLWH